jgi:hypothetical protein
MQLRVRNQGDEVHVDVDGVAGRQQRVLQALNECQRLASCSPLTSALGDLSIRAGADRMRIRIRARDGLCLEASAIYRCLRDALIDRRGTDGAGVSAA